MQHSPSIFSEDKETYSLKISDVSSEDLNTGLWLVLAGVNDIPPHIALISEGKYFSVSARKVEVEVEVSTFLKAISRRNLPTLFVALKSPHLGSPDSYRDSRVELKAVFEKYPTLGNGPHSCLWPVRDFFTKTFSREYSNANLVFELLALAQKQQILLDCKSMFVAGETITLPKYTSEHIRERINSLLKINE